MQEALFTEKVITLQHKLEQLLTDDAQMQLQVQAA